MEKLLTFLLQTRNLTDREDTVDVIKFVAAAIDESAEPIAKALEQIQIALNYLRATDEELEELCCKSVDEDVPPADDFIDLDNDDDLFAFCGNKESNGG